MQPLKGRIEELERKEREREREIARLVQPLKERIEELERKERERRGTLRNSQSQATVSSSKRHAFLHLEKLFFMPAVHFCLTVASIYCNQHLKPF